MIPLAAEPGDPYEVEVNGFDTRHYVLSDEALGLGVAGSEDIESASGDVYVATLPSDETIIVRSLISSTGNYNTLTETTGPTETDYFYELDQVNEPLDLAIPIGCQAQEAAASAYPIYPGAVQDMAAAGVFAYTITGATMDDLLTFYREEMVALGWKVVDDTGSPAYYNLGFTKDGQRVDFTFSDQGGEIGLFILES